jgi:hypothetical protein
MKVKFKLFLKKVSPGRALSFVHSILFKTTYLNYFYDRGFSHLLSTGNRFDNKVRWELLSEYYAKHFNAPPDTIYLNYIKDIVDLKT